MSAEPPRMDWAKLISRERWGGSARRAVPAAEAAAGNAPGFPDGEYRSPFDRDYGRILYSSAFRRLQDKTQVFPLGRDDYVRTRLTHSLETAHIGSSLGKLVGEALLARHASLRERGARASDFGAIVASACLAHDIGNPPFGHFGESAIEAALEKARERGDVPEDFPKKFEGNAQGFRLLTRTGDSMAGKGLKLTAAVLGAFMKYPCSERFSEEGRGGIAGKKFGFVADDAAAARFVAEKTGMLPCPDAGTELAWRRHPLAFLMEAADDLSYLVADFEDALVSRVISFDAFREYLFPMLAARERSAADSIAASEGEESAARYVRAVALGHGIREVRRAFLEREDALLAGTQNRTMLEESALGECMKKLRDFSLANIYEAREVAEIELTGFHVVEALFEFFSEWIRAPRSAKSKKIARTIGGEALAEATPHARTTHLLDCISGMTDSYALALYRKLHGV